MKINAKLGGINSIIHEDPRTARIGSEKMLPKPLREKGHFMVVGIDVCHGTESEPSIAAVYASEVFLQEPRKEVISKDRMKDAMMSLFREFAMANYNHYPECKQTS
eukprot:gene1449-32824_t